MQIYALDQEKTLVSVQNALSGQKYFCPECHFPVYIRGGRWVRRHFYHSKHPRICRLSGKSLVHLQIQLSLQRMLAPEEILLEYRFESINRIADVVWPAEKLIFEVQYSPISPEEIAARNSDYAQLGFTTIWILHERRYNRSRLTAAEDFLQTSPHYFTSLKADGTGIFYDQFSKIRNGYRVFRSPKFPIHVKRLTRGTSHTKQFLDQLPKERHTWPLFFATDLFHQKYDFNSSNVFCKFALKKHWNIFTSFFHYLLETACDSTTSKYSG